MSRPSFLLLLCLVAAAAAPALAQQISAEDFARVRCSLDGSSVCVRHVHFDLYRYSARTSFYDILLLLLLLLMPPLQVLHLDWLRFLVPAAAGAAAAVRLRRLQRGALHKGLEGLGFCYLGFGVLFWFLVVGFHHQGFGVLLFGVKPFGVLSSRV